MPQYPYEPGSDETIVLVEGREVAIDDETTAGAVKELVNGTEQDIICYRESVGELSTLRDDDQLTEYVNGGAMLQIRPDPFS